jgi:hypothetical protein
LLYKLITLEPTPEKEQKNSKLCFSLSEIYSKLWRFIRSGFIGFVADLMVWNVSGVLNFAVNSSS